MVVGTDVGQTDPDAFGVVVGVAVDWQVVQTELEVGVAVD